MFEFKELGHGMSRYVYQHPTIHDRVIKVANGVQGLEDNLSEAWVWLQANNDYRQFLTPVWDWSEDGRWQVMQKARPIDKMTLFQATWWKNKIRSVVMTVPQALTWDSHTSNIGVCGGKPVIIDYASHVKWGDEEALNIDNTRDLSDRFLTNCIRRVEDVSPWK